MNWRRSKRGFTNFVPALAVFVLVAIGWTGSAAGACKSPSIHTAGGCKSPAAVSQKLTRIVKGVKRDKRLRAVIARVDVHGRRVLRRGFGESQTGIRARPNMNFRVGAMTVPFLTSAIYQLRDEGRLRLTDPISEWLPGMPGASKVTVRMLMNNTSGYLDWIQGNQAFFDQLYANPFRLWSDRELIRIAFDRGFACDPGTCFNYAHTNYSVLAHVLRKATRGTLVSQLRRRVLNPLGIRMRFSRLAPIPNPVLAAYTSERGVFEESTGWSPSWGLGNGMLATSSIDDVIREARGVLSGRTLSRYSRKDMVKQYGPGLPSNPKRVYFAQGVVMANGWRRQNPYFNGHMGNVAWFPKKRIAVGLVATRGMDTPPNEDRNFTDDILEAIGAYLTPSNSPALR